MTTTHNKKKLREEWKAFYQSESNYYISDSREGLDVEKAADFWLSHLTTERTALIEEMRHRVINVLSEKYEEIERINPKLENMIMYCLSEEYDDSPKSSHLESGNEKIQ